MKGSKHQDKMIQYAVQALQEEANERFKNVQCKKEKTMFTVIKRYSEEIVVGMFMVMLLGFTIDNLNTSRAMDVSVNDRSPAVVEMYMAHDDEVSDEE